MKTFDGFIRDRMAKAKYAFTMAEALMDLPISENAFKCGMYKLKKKGDVISPVKGLFVIVPFENRAIGCLPPEDLIPIIFKYLGVGYYACLLSAALYHGASHQKPQVFQVISEKRLLPISFGKVRIEFIYKKSIKNLPLKKITVHTGYLEISSPELTVMDLFLYLHHSGGINHIATVLSELIEAIEVNKLIKFIDVTPEKFWIQRFGYILEKIEPMDEKKRDELVEAVYEKMKDQFAYPVALSPELPTKGASRNNRWKIIENTTVESDI